MKSSTAGSTIRDRKTSVADGVSTVGAEGDPPAPPPQLATKSPASTANPRVTTPRPAQTLHFRFPPHEHTGSFCPGACIAPGREPAPDVVSMSGTRHWVQRVVPGGTSVTVNDVTPIANRWNGAIVKIRSR
jgi:hypothetical protein